ncbi:unnamed protein product [Caenorhabditis sp. 36 PRJEB53466]|nr:unnamed protein product [Caenorhabditis sp. 36 PRJEB53466]
MFANWNSKGRNRSVRAKICGESLDVQGLFFIVAISPFGALLEVAVLHFFLFSDEIDKYEVDYPGYTCELLRKFIPACIYTAIISLIGFWVYCIPSKLFRTFAFLAIAIGILLISYSFNPYYDYIPGRIQGNFEIGPFSCYVLLLVIFLIPSSFVCAWLFCKMSKIRIRNEYDGDDVYEVIYGEETSSTKKAIL